MVELGASCSWGLLEFGNLSLSIGFLSPFNSFSLIAKARKNV